MSKKITHKEFVTRIANINPNILILGEYSSMKERIKVRCKLCGHEWSPTADKIVYGRGCPNCKAISVGNRCRMSHEDFVHKLNTINPNIEILSKYTNTNVKLKCRCKTDGYIWFASPSNLLYQKTGCPKCSHCYRRTPEEFIKEMSIANANIEILTDFNGVDKKVKCKCKIDNHIWYATPHELLSGTGCPQCCESKGEKVIREWLKKNEYVYESQKTFDNLIGVGGMPLSYDFYIPTINVLIEYQGEQHEKPFNYFGGEKKLIVQKEHDKRKKIYAETNGFYLLEIWYWDFDNIEKVLAEKLEDSNGR